MMRFAALTWQQKGICRFGGPTIQRESWPGSLLDTSKCLLPLFWFDFDSNIY